MLMLKQNKRKLVFHVNVFLVRLDHVPSVQPCDAIKWMSSTIKHFPDYVTKRVNVRICREFEFEDFGSKITKRMRFVIVFHSVIAATIFFSCVARKPEIGYFRYKIVIK